MLCGARRLVQRALHAAERPTGAVVAHRPVPVERKVSDPVARPGPLRGVFRVAWRAAAAAALFVAVSSPGLAPRQIDAWYATGDFQVVADALELSLEPEERGAAMQAVASNVQTLVLAMDGAAAVDSRLSAQVEARRDWLLAVYERRSTGQASLPDFLARAAAASGVANDPASTTAERAAAIDELAELAGGALELLAHLQGLEAVIESADSRFVPGDGEPVRLSDNLRAYSSQIERLLDPSASR